MTEMAVFAGRPNTSTRAPHALAERRLSWVSWGALSISIAAYVIATLAMHSPFHVGSRALNEFDLQVYHGAAQRLASGQNVYGARIWRGLGFTYPPFAALVFLPLAWAAFAVDRDAVTAINLVLLVWMLRRALLIPMATGGEPPRPVTAWSIAALAGAVAIWLEPISVTLGYGQINLLIAALVVFDLSLPDDRRGKGAAIGVAAAIKLTPLLFVVYLLLTHRRRAAARAVAMFTGSIALAYLVLPHDAASYWGHGRFLSTKHIGNAVDLANQSLHGALLRLSHTGQITAGGYLATGVIVLAGLALAVSAARRGDHAAGYSLAALTTLLASPISWTHHWTLAVPAILLLARRAHDRRSTWLWAATGTLCSLGVAYVPERLAHADLLQHPGPLTLLTTDPYVLTAILTLAVTAGVMARHTREDRSGCATRWGDRRQPADHSSCSAVDAGWQPLRGNAARGSEQPGQGGAGVGGQVEQQRRDDAEHHRRRGEYEADERDLGVRSDRRVGIRPRARARPARARARPARALLVRLGRSAGDRGQLDAGTGHRNRGAGAEAAAHPHRRDDTEVVPQGDHRADHQHDPQPRVVAVDERVE